MLHSRQALRVRASVLTASESEPLGQFPDGSTGFGTCGRRTTPATAGALGRMARELSGAGRVSRLWH